METSQVRTSRSPLKYIAADVGVASLAPAFVSPFVAVLLARAGVMGSDGLLHDWFYAVPAEFLALGPWNVALVYPVAVVVYLVQYLVFYTGLAAILRAAMKWMKSWPS